MAQGCHLIYSHSDKEHFPLDEKIEHPTVKEVGEQFRAAFQLPWGNTPSQGIVREDGAGIRIDRGRANACGVDDGRVQTFEERYGKLSEKERAFVAGLVSARSDCQADILAGLGNPYLDNRMAASLPGALAKILEHDPKTTGLFNKARSGASSWISTLKNSNPDSARGFAYEVLATASLIGRPAGNLRIGAGDHVDLGQKMQARYGSRGNLIVSDGWMAGFFFQPARETVEADLLITRPFTPFGGGGDQVAVDFKHSHGDARIEEEQLQGVKVVLETGEVAEWHFVSNASFDSTVVRQVNEINAELRDGGHPTIQLHSNYDWS